MQPWNSQIQIAIYMCSATVIIMLCVVYVCVHGEYVSITNNYYDVDITMALIKNVTERVDQLMDMHIYTDTHTHTHRYVAL